MSIALTANGYSASDLVESALAILEDNYLCAVATVGPNAKSHIHTAYFAFTRDLDFYFLSDPGADHSHNLDINGTVAVAVYDSHQPWYRPKRGLQLFGQCREAHGTEVANAGYEYAKRFISYRNWLKSLKPAQRKAFRSRFYVVIPSLVKLFDEPRFGEETFVSAEVTRGPS